MRRRSSSSDVESHSGARLAAQRGVAPQARPLLLVEDDRSSLRLIEAGLDVLRLANPRDVARSGDEAFEILSSAASGARALPALVLLDIGLPGRSGLEVLSWMRGQPALVDVPVILLTADGTADSIRRAYAAGASSYLVKPVGFDALADVLRGMEVPWTLL